MKTPIAAALAVSGVLVAGSAAALVNSQMFDGATDSGASAAVLPPPSSIELSIPDPTVPPASDAPTTSAAPTTVPATDPATTAAPATGMLTAFEVGEAGVVTVDVIDGRLVFVAAEPSPGWSVVERSTEDGGRELEVVFTSADVRVEFDVELEDGQIVPKVESEAIGRSTATAPASSGSTPTASTPSYDEDDDHDEYEDDDRYEDDDHDEYEDHDEDEDHDRDDD